MTTQHVSDYFITAVLSSLGLFCLFSIHVGLGTVNSLSSNPSRFFMTKNFIDATQILLIENVVLLYNMRRGTFFCSV